MAETQLPAVTSSGSQTNTQSPQSAGPATSTTNAGSVQPGTANSLLTSNNGVSLTPTQVTTVSLGQSAGSTPVTPVSKHHFNSALMGISILLFVMAVIMFKFAGNSGKNHNQYK
jgi:hypothetical protein